MNVWQAARRLGVIFARPRFESDMNDELQFHLEMQIEQLVQSGLSRQDARRHALIDIGGLEKTREYCREAVGIR